MDLDTGFILHLSSTQDMTLATRFVKAKGVIDALNRIYGGG